MRTETKVLLFAMFIMASTTWGIWHHERSFYPPISVDEKVWQNISTNWLSPETQAHDNKSPVFLLINNLLEIDKTVLYTRILNYIIIIICTYLVWSMTKIWESLLLPIIFYYADQMVLLDTSFEVLFILLSIKYNQHSGIFTGLSAIFRPYAAIYTLLLKREQQAIVMVIGAIYAAFLLATGSFFPYLFNLIGYAHERIDAPLTPFIFLIFFAVLGHRNKNLFKYGLVASFPLIIRQWGHYFIPGMVLFFLSYLSIQNGIHKPNA